MNLRFGLLLWCIVQSANVPAEIAPRVFHFAASLDGKRIGEHRFEVHADGGRTRVTSRAQFEVTFLLFTAYRYWHEATEIWDGDCLTRIDARTDDNGRAYTITGERLPNLFRVATGDATQELPGCVLSFAYWDPRILDAKFLLNAQTGAYQSIEVERLGPDSVPVGDVPVLAERWRLRAEDLAIDLWYAADGRWLALESEAGGGRRLRYTLDR